MEEKKEAKEETGEKEYEGRTNKMDKKAGGKPEPEAMRLQSYI